MIHPKVFIVGDDTESATDVLNTILRNDATCTVVWGLLTPPTSGGSNMLVLAAKPNYVAHGMRAEERHVDDIASECVSIVWVSNSAGPPPHVLETAEHHNTNLIDINLSSMDDGDVQDLWTLLTDGNLLFVPPDPELIDWPLDQLPIPPPRHFLRAMRGRLAPEFWTTRASFLKMEQNQSKPIFPPPELRLRAFSHTPLCRVRVVIMGQDPYPQQGNADGLAFSVPCSRVVPASLKTILDELHRDPEVEKPLRVSEGIDDGNHTPRLECWAKQGVFLCNAVLTVRESSPASHQRIAGWEILTDQCIAAISDETEFCIFMLWGQVAQTKTKFIHQRHLVLRAGHPSPRNQGKGFAMCSHFSKANAALRNKGFAPIAW